MESEEAKKGNINRDYVKSYCASYTNNILETAFKESPYLQGSDLKELCNPEQINFNLLKAIFLQWEAEVNKFHNPYFDHEAPAVQSALKTYMQVLSRHIKLDKRSLRPLLQEAVEETLYQVFEPKHFFENFLWPLDANTMAINELVKLKRFLKINVEFYQELLKPWIEKQQPEISKSDYWKRLNHVVNEWELWEDTKDYASAFSKVVALNTKALWDQPVQEEEDNQSTVNNVNQRFAREVTSLNDTLQNHQNTLVDELTKKVEKIDNLNKSLNINQKFRFTNELFGGDKNEFESVVKKVDECLNYDQAIKELDGGASLRSQWDEQNQVVQEFLTLISKRFSAPGPAFGERPSSAK